MSHQPPELLGYRPKSASSSYSNGGDRDISMNAMNGEKSETWSNGAGTKDLNSYPSLNVETQETQEIVCSKDADTVEDFSATEGATIDSSNDKKTFKTVITVQAPKDTDEQAINGTKVEDQGAQNDGVQTVTKQTGADPQPFMLKASDDLVPVHEKDKAPPVWITSPGKVSPADVDTMPMRPSTAKDDASETSEKKKEKTQTEMVGFFEIFKFADCLDVFLMLLGTVCAAGHGAAFPGMIIVFGEMIDLFVGAGVYQSAIDAMRPYNTLAELGLTEADVLKNPALLTPNLTYITSDTLGTVDIALIFSSIQTQLLDTMTTYAIYFCIIGGAVLILGYGQVTCWMLSSERQTHRIRVGFFRNVMRQEIGWFDTNESGELNSRLADDISKIHDGIGDKLGAFTQWFCGFLGGFIIGFIYGWKLTLVILAISPLLAGAAFVMTKLVAMASGQELKAYAKAGAIAEEVLGAIRTVVAFSGQSKECDRYQANLKQACDIGIRKGLINGFTMGLVWLIIFGAYALGFWYGAKLAREEADLYTIGNVMIVFFAVLIGAFSLGNAAPNLQSMSVARGAAFMIYQLIKKVPSIDSYSKEGTKLEHFEGDITLNNVHFNYPSRPDVKVLQGVNLRINHGQTVALVGSSGCGKSTIVQLIQRFYDPSQGMIQLDRTNINDLNVHWLRQNIGIVSQEPVLFDTTIAENVRYGLDEATDKDIEEACKMANAHDFIMNLPDKYETLVGERGAQLSGGQKQRVAIARALISDPRILLLDEATSALDTESEGVVQEALEKASHGRTTIVIAHRLSTIKNADKIAGFRDGVIAEEGTHSELMAKGGIYNKLVTQQTRLTDDDEAEDDEPNLEAEAFEHPGISHKPSLVRQKSSVMDTPDKKRTISTSGEPIEEADKKKKKKSNAGLGRIMKLNAPEWYLIVLGCIASLINGGVMPAFAIIFSEIIGVFSLPAGEQEDKIALYSGLFVGLGVMSFFTYLTQGYMFGRSGEFLTLRLRGMSLKAMLRQDIAWFDDHKNNTGSLTTRLATDASQVQGAAGIRLGSTIMSICSLLTGMIIAFIYGWKLTLVILAFMPLLVIGGALQMQMLAGAAGKNKEALEAAGKVAVEGIENIRTVVSLTKEEMFYQNYLNALHGPYREALVKAHVVGITFSFSQAVIFFCYAASFWFGAYLITENEMEFVNVFKVFSAVVFGAMAIGQASSFAPDAGKAQASAEQIFALLDSVPEIDSESTEGDKPGKYTSRVTFNDVEFRYPTRPDIQVLDKFNITIEEGQTVALVGSSGCGKSTSVQLIERFYNPAAGDVCLDSHKLTDLNVQWLRRQIGIVQQEPILFDRSIADNIAYGDNERVVTMPEIMEAARNANIHSFITSLPEGYETNVGEKGAQLSGGQKQRVAIARALVRNPRILLLDEATSALDTESEKIVQEALDKAREGRTCIVIAHRLSTIQNADKICVIRHGVVTEEGKHSDLMKKQGFYYKLNMAQARTK